MDIWDVISTWNTGIWNWHRKDYAKNVNDIFFYFSLVYNIIVIKNYASRRSNIKHYWVFILKPNF